MFPPLGPQWIRDILKSKFISSKKSIHYTHSYNWKIQILTQAQNDWVCGVKTTSVGGSAGGWAGRRLFLLFLGEAGDRFLGNNIIQSLSL